MIKEIEGTNLVAISVPADLEIHKSWFSTECEEVFESGYRLLGTVIKDKIGFDVEPYVDKYNDGSYRDYINTKSFCPDNNTIDIFLTKEESFYSRLEVNGIIDFEKLLIIEKIKL